MNRFSIHFEIYTPKAPVDFCGNDTVEQAGIIIKLEDTSLQYVNKPLCNCFFCRHFLQVKPFKCHVSQKVFTDARAVGYEWSALPKFVTLLSIYLCSTKTKLAS